MNGLTATQRIFVGICRRLGFPTEQITIFLSILSQEELKKSLEWIATDTKAKGRLLTRRELSEHLHDKSVKIISEERTDNS